MRLTSIVLLLLVWDITFAQSPIYETTASGDWNDAIWLCTANCAGAPAIPNLNAHPNPQVTIKHVITKSGGLSLSSSGGANISAVFIENTASLTVTGLLDVKNETSFENQGTLVVVGKVDIQSEFINSGTISATTIEVKFGGLTDFISTGGTIDVDNILLGGKSTVTNTTITTDEDFTITGSAIVAVNSLLVNVGRDFIFNGAANTTFGANMNVGRDIIHGASSALTLTGSIVVAGDFENSGAGTVTLTNGATIDVTGDFLNEASGIVNINLGTELDIVGDFLNSGDSDININGSLIVSQLINLIGSTEIDGTGTLSWGTFNCEGGARIRCGGVYYGPSTNCLPPDFTGNSLTLGACTVVLPVTWLSISATKKSVANEVNWSTASEKNNDYFIIESSINGIDFEEIGRIKGNGTTDENRHYNFLDYQTVAPIVYYRVLQVDFDGASSYSTIVSLIDNNTSSIQIYPNPVINNEIWVNSIDNEVINVALFSHLGQTITVSDNISLSTGYQKLIALEDTYKGMYYLQITLINGTREIYKVIVE